MEEIHNMGAIQSTSFRRYCVSGKKSDVCYRTVFAMFGAPPRCVASGCPVLGPFGQTFDGERSEFLNISMFF